MHASHTSPNALSTARARLLLLSLVLTGCMSSPRDGSSLSSSTDPLVFEGMTHSPGAKVKIAVMNLQTQRWDDLATITADTTATPDAIGTNWYHWGQFSAKIPDDRRYWLPDERGKSTIYAQVRAYDSSVPNGYVTFTSGADICLQLNQASGGVAMANNCHSGRSPSAIISAPCGRSGQPACGNWCNAGMVADRDNRCRPCGGENQQCCNASTNDATHECNQGLKCKRDEQLCKSGVVINPPGLIPQVCSTSTTCSPDWTKEQCIRESVDSNCYAVVAWCKDTFACYVDGQLLTRKESERYYCGFCLGF